MKAFTNIDKKENEALTLYRNDAFDIGFYQYFSGLERNKISELLNNRERNVKLDTVTYRQLNSWEKEGLLTNGREGREWRRFNIIEYCYKFLKMELQYLQTLARIKLPKNLKVLKTTCK